MEPKEQWVACWGNPYDGFQLVGLFDNHMDALTWADQHIYTDSWWVISVQTTQEFEKENEGV